MNYALDSELELVSAEEAKPRYRYQCPVAACGARVYLRSSHAWSSNKPHFAHSQGEALPECENFFPGMARVWEERRVGDAPDASVRRHSNNLNVYLSEMPLGIRLAIYIPPSRSETIWTGIIRINGKVGVEQIDHKRALQGITVEVSASSAPLEMTFSGDVDLDLLAVLRDHITLPAPVNVFDIGNTKARSLHADETLIWGGDYWVLVHEMISIPNSLSSYLEQVAELSGFRVYRLSMPKWDSRPLGAVITFDWQPWLGHTIKKALPSCWLVSPFPEYFDDMDIAVVSDQARSVLIQFSAPAEEIAVFIDENLNKFSRPSEHTIEFIVAGCRSATVEIEGRVALHVRFLPLSEHAFGIVEFVQGEMAVPFLDSGEVIANLRALGRTPEAPSLRFPSKYIERLAKVNGEAYSAELLNQAILDRIQPLAIYIDSFGGFEFDARDRPYKGHVFQQDKLLSWLLTLPEASAHEPFCGLGLKVGQGDSLRIKIAKQRRWRLTYATHVLALRALLKTPPQK